MNKLTITLIACGIMSASAVDHNSCIDNNGKKPVVKFIDNNLKKRSYALLEVVDSKVFMTKGNRAGRLPNGEIIVKTSATTSVSLGKVTEKCVTKPKVYASL